MLARSMHKIVLAPLALDILHDLALT
ncbi:hypothetical protein EMEDMD4_1060043 [Sinorhizobium medicae]|uniref:Uncharacterized protein n=1 Tax=Sinorhizobium medicae TaxID=110321 RepID=A0A508WUR5_9HYPH|nr:hypothetical protein EMEDMD4_1060043 [Sinorhizobium medicae]